MRGLLVENVCCPVKYPSCQQFVLIVDWLPAKCSIRLGDAVSQKKIWSMGLY